jgi:Tol biopolymer transport system component
MRELAMLLATAALATATAPLAEQLGTATAGSPEVVLKAAINRELVTGDTAAAIGHYRAMANDNSATAPAVAAQALVQLAASYERLGRPEARATYEEILQVQDGSEHQWTPDGRRIIYRSGPRDQFKEFSLVERDLASGVERTIARGPFVAFSVSPDGRFIAAHLADIEPGIGYAVVEVRVDSGQMRDLLRAGPSERFAPYVAPQWTPDGQAVIVRKRTPNEVWFVPTGGGAPRKLDVDGTGWSLGWVGQFSIHPDGRRVAYVSGALSSEVMVLEHFLPGR